MSGRDERGGVDVFAHRLGDEDDGDGGGLGELAAAAAVCAVVVFDGGVRGLGLDVFERRGGEVDGLAPDGAAGLGIGGVAAG